MPYRLLKDSQDDAPVCYCQSCHGEVYRGEKRFEFEQKRVCVDCFKDGISSWLERSPEQVAPPKNSEQGGHHNDRNI